MFGGVAYFMNSLIFVWSPSQVLKDMLASTGSALRLGTISRFSLLAARQALWCAAFL